MAVAGRVNTQPNLLPAVLLRELVVEIPVVHRYGRGLLESILKPAKCRIGAGFPAGQDRLAPEC